MRSSIITAALLSAPALAAVMARAGRAGTWTIQLFNNQNCASGDSDGANEFYEIQSTAGDMSSCLTLDDLTSLPSGVTCKHSVTGSDKTTATDDCNPATQFRSFDSFQIVEGSANIFTSGQCGSPWSTTVTVNTASGVVSAFDPVFGCVNAVSNGDKASLDGFLVAIDESGLLGGAGPVATPAA